MAKFTLTDDATEVSSVTMHAGHANEKGSRGHKRLHLAGVSEKDHKALMIDSTDDKIVKVVAARKAFDASAGIWTVDLYALQKGQAEIQAKVMRDSVARVAVTVFDKLELPPQDTDAGLLVRLFLAETAPPEDNPMWTEEDAKKSMQWERLVLKNRLANNPQQFMAKGAKALKDIVTAKDLGKAQFEGFSNYPPPAAKITARIAEELKIANDDSDKRQEDYATFVQAALDVANSKTEIQDPCGADNFLSGWMTVGSSPGDDSVKFQAIMDNQFFMMKRKK